jgi:hypothetical protein
MGVHILSTDTYTRDELSRMSLWCMESESSGVTVINLGLRDRAMLLLSCSTALRGDNTRSLLLSDLSYRETPIPDLGDNATLFVGLVFFYPLRSRLILTTIVDNDLLDKPRQDKQNRATRRTWYL